METETEDVLNLNSKGSVSAAFLAAVIKRFANDILSKKGFILAQVWSTVYRGREVKETWTWSSWSRHIHSQEEEKSEY